MRFRPGCFSTAPTARPRRRKSGHGVRGVAAWVRAAQPARNMQDVVAPIPAPHCWLTGATSSPRRGAVADLARGARFISHTLSHYRRPCRGGPGRRGPAAPGCGGCAHRHRDGRTVSIDELLGGNSRVQPAPNRRSADLAGGLAASSVSTIQVRGVRSSTRDRDQPVLRSGCWKPRSTDSAGGADPKCEALPLYPRRGPGEPRTLVFWRVTFATTESVALAAWVPVRFISVSVMLLSFWLCSVERWKAWPSVGGFAVVGGRSDRGSNITGHHQGSRLRRSVRWWRIIFRSLVEVATT